MTRAEPIDLSLFTWPADEPRLIGGECGRCGAVAFPRPSACSRCTSDDIRERVLDRRGTLWSYTIQRFRPKAPYDGPGMFEPYGVGYVELDDGVVVESRLTTADPDQLEIGASMELVLESFGTRRDGISTVTLAFRPVTDEEPAR